MKGEVHTKASTVNKQCAMTSEFGCLTDHTYVFGAANLQGPAEVSGITHRCNCSPVKVKHSESGLRGLAYFQQKHTVEFEINLAFNPFLCEYKQAASKGLEDHEQIALTSFYKLNFM